MERRNFLRTLVGGVAVAAAARTFPFKVFSFPTEIRIATNPLNEAMIQAIELESIRETIPDLLLTERSFYSLLKKRGPVLVSSRSFRVPIQDSRSLLLSEV